MSKQQREINYKKILVIAIIASVILVLLDNFIPIRNEINSAQILKVNDIPFNTHNFLVDAETLSQELQQIGIDVHIDIINNNFVLIPRSIDPRHTTELMFWGNWLNANYGTATHDLGTGGTIQQNDTLSFQFAHTNTMGAYSFIRRVVDERGIDYAELYSGTYWIDENNILHLHYRFLINNEGDILESLDLHQQWLFEWVYTSIINLWQPHNPTEVMQLQRVSLP